jgi:hypothetical protein
VALTITDKIMRSDETAHTALLEHFEAGDAWRVSWLPQRLMARNAAITAMTLAELVSEGEGIDLHDDPRGPVIDALAAELCLSGPDAVVRISETGRGNGVLSGAAGLAGTVLRAHADKDGRDSHLKRVGGQCPAGTADNSSQAFGGAYSAQARAQHVKEREA